MLPHGHHVHLQANRSGSTAMGDRFLGRHFAYEETSHRKKAVEDRHSQSSSRHQERHPKESCFLARMKGRSSEQSHILTNREDKEWIERCSPRVRNLQVEMDMLRSEIQRLKSIDIHKLPSAGIKANDPKHVCQSQTPQQQRERHCSKEEARLKLMQLGLVSHASDSDASEQTNSDVEDFEGFIKQLRQEQDVDKDSDAATLEPTGAGVYCNESNVSVHSSQPRKSGINQDLPGTDKACEEWPVSRGTDPRPFTCTQCLTLQTEKFDLVGELHQLQDRLRDQGQRHRNAEIEAQQYREEIQALRTNRPVMRDVGVMVIDQSTAVEKPTAEKALQCDLINTPCTEELEEEIRGLQQRFMDSEAVCAALREENEELKNTRGETTAVDFENAMVQDQTRDSLFSMLANAGIQNAIIPSIISEIRQTFPIRSESASPDQSLLVIKERFEEETNKLQETHKRLQQEKAAEISDLTEEKNVLTQKVLELRKAVKKETSEREAAQLETTKLQNNIKEQYSEMEQCRSLVQQKRQQISELEDTLAVMQHENENWERDYEILTRRKDQIERELRIAKNLESNGPKEA